MRNINEHTITAAVLERMAECADPRLKEIMSALVRHLHDFAREVKLTEAEWCGGIEFLTATGQKCDDKRQEFILLSDTLGLSMLTVALNHAKSAQATEATVFGPFHVPGAPRLALGGDISGGAKGEPLFVRRHGARPRRRAGGRCARSTSGRPMPKASTTCSAPDSTARRAARCSAPTPRAGCGSAA